MNTIGRASLILLLIALGAGCAEDKGEPKGVIPQGYTDALKKAEGVEALLEESHRKSLEEPD